LDYTDHDARYLIDYQTQSRMYEAFQNRLPCPSQFVYFFLVTITISRASQAFWL
jgi:hypothetical protein